MFSFAIRFYLNSVMKSQPVIELYNKNSAPVLNLMSIILACLFFIKYITHIMKMSETLDICQNDKSP